MHVALAMRDILPQLTKLDGLVDVSTHLVAVEEVGRMDVVAPAIIPIPLLHRTDVANEVVEYRVSLMLSNQLIQVIEHMLDT
ncbi:hypothetical protein D9M71_538500 [compost metagenome]